MNEIFNVSLPAMHLIVAFEIVPDRFYQCGVEYYLFVIDEQPIYNIIISLN